jgi:hypothetical protein
VLVKEAWWMDVWMGWVQGERRRGVYICEVNHIYRQKK